MAKETNLKIRLLPTLNRALTLTAFPMGKPIHFSILHDKKTSALQFQVDPGNQLVKNNQIFVSMYRNLENCKFCQTFFHLETETNSRVDFRSKFSGINRAYEREIFKFLSEKVDFHVDNGSKPSNNYLLVLGWKIFGLEDDLHFYFIQRKVYNNITKMQIIRTAGLQFATNRGLDKLNKYSIKSENQITKVDKICFSADLNKK